MAGYLPSNDGQFSTWATRFITYLQPRIAQFGLTEAEIAPFLTEHPEWETKLTVHTNARVTAKSACAAKDEQRATLETIIRSLAGRINAYPSTTDADREALGLKPKSSDVYVPTVLGMTDDKPTATIDISNRLKHVVRVENRNQTGTSRAKPVGVWGCEVWRKIGEPPTGPSDVQYVSMFTRYPFELQYPDEDAGKTVHYLFRWVTRAGEKGNWSDTESATIAA